jgi:branched-chain amino acid transport system permease protein
MVKASAGGGICKANPSASMFRAVRPRTLVFWGIIVVAVLWVAIAGSSFTVFLADLMVIYAIAALAQDWLIGRAGQVSLGGAAFMAIGAYTTGALVYNGITNFFVIAAASLLMGAILGFLVGLPALRLRGLYLLLSTLALQYIVAFAAQEYQSHVSAGGLPVPPADVFGVQFSNGKSAFVILIVIAVIVMGVLQSMYVRAPGRAWQSIKESELASSVVGVNVVRWKLTAFTGSSALTALAGCLFAYYSGIVSYETFSLTLAITLIVMVFVGGVGTLAGPLIGALFVVLIPYGLQQLSADVPSSFPLSSWLTNNESTLASGIYGLALLFILLYEQGGVVVAVPRAAHGIANIVLRRAARSKLPESTEVPASALRPKVRVEDSDVTPTDLLVVRDLRVAYPSGAAGVQGLSFSVPEGAVVGLIGTNGAGKTSTLRSIAGFPRSDRVQVDGRITFDGQALNDMSAQKRAHRGIVLVPERDKVCASLTVGEHLRLLARDEDAAKDTLDRFPIIATKRSSRAGLLSGGERQRVAIALAWSRRPKLVMLDELSLGLAPVAVADVMTELSVIRESGATVVLVDQDASAMLDICDYVYVLDHGVVVSEGLPGSLRQEAISLDGAT